MSSSPDAWQKLGRSLAKMAKTKLEERQEAQEPVLTEGCLRRSLETSDDRSLASCHRQADRPFYIGVGGMGHFPPRGGPIFAPCTTLLFDTIPDVHLPDPTFVECPLFDQLQWRRLTRCNMGKTPAHKSTPHKVHLFEFLHLDCFEQLYSPAHYYLKKFGAAFQVNLAFLTWKFRKGGGVSLARCMPWDVMCVSMSCSNLNLSIAQNTGRLAENKFSLLFWNLTLVYLNSTRSKCEVTRTVTRDSRTDVSSMLQTIFFSVTFLCT